MSESNFSRLSNTLLATTNCHWCRSFPTFSRSLLQWRQLVYHVTVRRCGRCLVSQLCDDSVLISACPLRTLVLFHQQWLIQLANLCDQGCRQPRPHPKMPGPSCHRFYLPLPLRGPIPFNTVTKLGIVTSLKEGVFLATIYLPIGANTANCVVPIYANNFCPRAITFGTAPMWGVKCFYGNQLSASAHNSGDVSTSALWRDLEQPSWHGNSSREGHISMESAMSPIHWEGFRRSKILCEKHVHSYHLTSMNAAIEVYSWIFQLRLVSVKSIIPASGRSATTSHV